MTDKLADLFETLPPRLADALDPAFRACGADRLRELIEGVVDSDGALRSSASTGGGARAEVRRHRWQDEIIATTVAEASSVLDLGCGSGKLLGRLIRERKVRGQGVEMDFSAVLACIEGGIPVFQANLDEGLAGFADHSFDCVILEETVQTLHKPLYILSEMLRVGRRGIVSFPNFGCWNVRLGLALNGRMPVTEELPYHWYDTPNIRLLTLADFQAWARDHRVRITWGYVFSGGCVRPLDYPKDNLLAEEVLLGIEPTG